MANPPNSAQLEGTTYHSGSVTKHTCDGQTDGQNYDSQDRASIAASRGTNYTLNLVVRVSRLRLWVGPH